MTLSDEPFLGSVIRTPLPQLPIEDSTTVFRLGKAILLGWGLRDPKPPSSPGSRGSIWVSKPGEHDEWWAEKASGEDWLVQCLNQAGVPE